MLMLTSWTKLLAILTLCSTTTLGACAMDDANSSDDATGGNGTVNSDAVTSDGVANASDGERVSIVNPDGIIVNISIRQWQTDLRAWQMFFATCRPSVTVDGDFGPMTTTATECFQRACGITADGVVGTVTLGRMCSTLEVIETTTGPLFNASHCTVADESLPACF
jgi:peptidoglycan hydrolase-like protein with peptidoglycan-binding domain